MGTLKDASRTPTVGRLVNDYDGVNMFRLRNSSYVIIFGLLALTACSQQIEVEKTAAAHTTQTAIAWRPTQTLAPTSVVTPTPLPDIVVVGGTDINQFCFPIWQEFPKVESFPVIGDIPEIRYNPIWGMRDTSVDQQCISSGDSYSLIGQLNHCEFLKIRTTSGEEGWILGFKNFGSEVLGSEVLINKKCEDIQALYPRPLNGSYTSFGNSLLFASVNILDSVVFDQGTFYKCNTSSCGAGNMYLGVIRIFNYTDTDAVVILSPYYETMDSIPRASQKMYIHAGENVSFPICEEITTNKALGTWISTSTDTGGSSIRPGIRCFAYRSSGLYKVYAITGHDYDDVENNFDDKPIYWSTSYILEVTKDASINYDLDVIVIHPDSTQEYFTDNGATGAVYELMPISQEEFPHP